MPRPTLAEQLADIQFNKFPGRKFFAKVSHERWIMWDDWAGGQISLVPMSEIQALKKNAKDTQSIEGQLFEILPRGGRTTVAIYERRGDEDVLLGTGVADCSRYDNFNHATGVQIALNRAREVARTVLAEA